MDVCEKCECGSYSMCPQGRRLLTQCKRSWRDLTNHEFQSGDEYVIAHDGFCAITAAFRKHAGHSWAIYAQQPKHPGIVHPDVRSGMTTQALMMASQNDVQMEGRRMIPFTIGLAVGVVLGFAGCYVLCWFVLTN